MAADMSAEAESKARADVTEKWQQRREQKTEQRQGRSKSGGRINESRVRVRAEKGDQR